MWSIWDHCSISTFLSKSNNLLLFDLIRNSLKSFSEKNKNILLRRIGAWCGLALTVRMCSLIIIMHSSLLLNYNECVRVNAAGAAWHGLQFRNSYASWLVVVDEPLWYAVKFHNIVNAKISVPPCRTCYWEYSICYVSVCGWRWMRCGRSCVI